MPEESSSEVTSSSAALVMSPANSLVSSDIGDVDLEFWDLDVNAQNQARLGIIHNGFGAVQGHTVLGNHHPAKSDTSSMSGINRAGGIFPVAATTVDQRLLYLLFKQTCA